MNNNDVDTSLEDTTNLSLPVSSEEPLESLTFNKYLYYVNQIYETDAFVGDLIKTLENFPEPIVVIFYGDHMPSLDITEEDLKDGTPFQMDYVMWDNMNLEKANQDLMAYQMSSMIMERLGYKNGLLNRFHQSMKDTENYEEELQLLQYDMLYGDKNVYGGKNPYIAKDMKMGIDPIVISDVTVFLDSQTLLVSHANSLKPFLFSDS